jgi:hypothetical protein
LILPKRWLLIENTVNDGGNLVISLRKDALLVDYRQVNEFEHKSPRLLALLTKNRSHMLYLQVARFNEVVL